MADVKNLDFNIRAFDQASVVFARVEGGMKKLEGAWGRLQGLASVAAVAFGVQKITAATIEMERMSSRLDAALKTTGYAAGATRAEIEGLAEELKNSTAFDDDQIRNGIASLLRFREVQGDVFRDAVKLAPDLAAAIDGDLVGAYQKLGRALQDPATGMKGLREAGVKLSESQLELAKKLQESGDAAGAQRIVLDALKASVGGAAGAENQGLYGAVKSLGKAWDDLLKSMGASDAFRSPVKSLLDETASGLRNIKEIIDSDDWTERWQKVVYLMRGGVSIPGKPAPGPTASERAQAAAGQAAAESEQRIAAAQKWADDKADEILKKREADAKAAAERAIAEQKRLLEEGKRGWIEYIDFLKAEDERYLIEYAKIQDERNKIEADARATAKDQYLKDIDDRIAREEERMRVYGESLPTIDDRIKKTDQSFRDFGLTLSSAFSKAVIDGDKFSDVLKGLGKDLWQLLVRAALLDPLQKSLSGMMGGGSAGGAGGGIGGLLAGIFGGGGASGASGSLNIGDALGYGGEFATGGQMTPNTWNLVGEKGPEMVWSGAGGGTVVPNGGGGGVSIVQNISIDARSDQASIRQAMEAARQQAVADVRREIDRNGPLGKATRG